jgi:hypothetical protein
VASWRSRAMSENEDRKTKVGRRRKVLSRMAGKRDFTRKAAFSRQHSHSASQHSRQL